MRRILVVVGLLALAGLAAVLLWQWTHRTAAPRELVLYGNVDLRQVDLPFNNSERIAAVLVQEGDRVKPGQILARLDTSRLKPQAAQAEALVEAQRQAVVRLHHGSRPEEIAQARANVAAAKAEAANARLHYDRLHTLFESSAGRSVVRQDVDSAKAVLDEDEAKVVVNEKALDLAVLGPRQEDIAQAEAQLRANEAQFELLRQQLADAELLAPADAVVRSRLMEPGEMASPAKPVFSLALIDPKWVRAYVSEPDLGHVHMGTISSVEVDSFPGRRFEGWVGFISPVAEFTPKSVETTDLRTSLVYEVRVFVKDPQDEMRLGMPATIHLPLAPPESPASTANSAATADSAATPAPTSTAAPASSEGADP
jgi:HlyD family secretion protein